MDSWLFSPSTVFDGAAQQLPNKTFVAVQDRRFVASWHESDPKLQKLVRRSFDEMGDVMNVMVDKKLEDLAVLAFSTGNVGLWTPSAMKLSQSIKVVDDDRYFAIAQSHTRRTQNDFGIFFLASKDSLLSGSYALFTSICIHTSNEGPHLKKLASHTLSTERAGHVITNFVFECASTASFSYASSLNAFSGAGNTQNQSLTVLWDDGLLQIYSLPGGIQGLSTPNSLVLMHSLPLNVYASPEVTKTISRHATKSTSKKNSKENAELSYRDLTHPSGNAMTNISDGYIAIGGAPTSRSNDENESETQKCLLTAWDLRYGLVQLQKELDLEDILENKTSTALPTRAPTKNANKKNSAQKKTPTRLLRQAVFSADRNAVLLNFGELVLVCPIYVAPSSLAQALGAQSLMKNLLLEIPEQQQQLSQQFDYLSHATVPLKSKNRGAGFMPVTKGDFDNIVSETISHESSVIAQLADKSKTPDYNTFMDTFNAYVALKTKESQERALAQEIDFSLSSAAGTSGSRKKWKNLQEYTEHENNIKSKRHERTRQHLHVDFSPAFVEPVVARCLSEDYLWLPLQKLLESRCVTIKLCPTLLSVLKAHNRLDLLSAALNFVSDISELEVVGVVRYLVNDVDQATMQIYIDEHLLHHSSSSNNKMETEISVKNSKNSSKKLDSQAAMSNASISTHGINKMPSSTISWQSPLDRFLNIVVSMSLDTVFLQYCLQLFTLKEMVAMLRYLLGWFEHSSELSDYANAKSEETEDLFAPPPSLGRVVAWANAIIDSHLTELILVPECARLLRRLHDAISHTIEVCDGMQLLRGCLVHYFDHDPTPRDSASDYSIEILRL